MRPSTTDPPPSTLRALTLLEVALAVAVAGVILTGVYGIALTTFELTSEVEESQRREANREAFLRFLERQFRELPPEADVTLAAGTRDGIPVSTLLIRAAPQAFSFRPAGLRADEVELRTEPEAGGTRRFRLTHRAGEEPLSSIVLLRGLLQCEWRMRETSAREWQTVWKENGTGRPRLLELQLAFSGEPPRRHVFWIPRVTPAPLPLPLPLPLSGTPPPPET